MHVHSFEKIRILGYPGDAFILKFEFSAPPSYEEVRQATKGVSEEIRKLWEETEGVGLILLVECHYFPALIATILRSTSSSHIYCCMVQEKSIDGYYLLWGSLYLEESGASLTKYGDLLPRGNVSLLE